MPVYVALYPEYGGPAKGFRCEVEIAGCHPDNGLRVQFQPCSKVTRTENGMKIHLRRVHGIRIQGDLFHNDQAPKVSEGIQVEASWISQGLDAPQESRGDETKAARPW